MQTAIVLSESELQEVLGPIVQQAIESALSKLKGATPTGQVEESDYLTLKQAAKYLQISKPTFIAIRKGGAFPAHPVGNRHLFRRSDLESYIQSRKLAT